MIFRAVNWVMAALFGVAMVVQYNDPDPMRWIAIYGAAMVVAGYAGRRGAVPAVAPLVVGGVALIWGLTWSTDVRAVAPYEHMFDHWQMKNTTVEEARETSGLLIVAGWMAVLALQRRWRVGAARARG
jgi:Transmembrane family 220, helix